MFCSNCGSQMRDDSMFCANCGASLTKQAEESPIAAAVNEEFDTGFERVTDKVTEPAAVPEAPTAPPKNKSNGLFTATLIFGLIGAVVLIAGNFFPVLEDYYGEWWAFTTISDTFFHLGAVVIVGAVISILALLLKNPVAHLLVTLVTAAVPGVLIVSSSRLDWDMWVGMYILFAGIGILLITSVLAFIAFRKRNN